MGNFGIPSVIPHFGTFAKRDFHYSVVVLVYSVSFCLATLYFQDIGPTNDIV